MATKTRKMISTSKFETPAISGKEAIQKLQKSIRIYERRYETSSTDMLIKVSSGEVGETMEILKWMQAYHALKSLEGATPTDGTHMTTTEPSTRNA